VHGVTELTPADSCVSFHSTQDSQVDLVEHTGFERHAAILADIFPTHGVGERAR
jgi:hypothetical protein